MKPAPFDYRAPGGLDEALALLAEHGFDARPLAGGQSLVPAMNFRLARPALVVENELFAPGWTASVSGGKERLTAVRVASGIGRPWRSTSMPAGATRAPSERGQKSAAAAQTRIAPTPTRACHPSARRGVASPCGPAEVAEPASADAVSGRGEGSMPER